MDRYTAYDILNIFKKSRFTTFGISHFLSRVLDNNKFSFSANFNLYTK